MMRFLKRLLATFGLIGLLLTSVVEAEGPWTELFNGRDLRGWKANAFPESFTVKDGVLIAHSTNELRSHLFYLGEDVQNPKRFKNFELKMLIRAEPKSNSGIFFHTDFEERDKKRHLANGYEVQLNSSPGKKRVTGSLYDIVDLDRAIVDERDWFELHLIVRDKKIVVKLNGKQVVEYSEPENPVRKKNRTGRRLRPAGGLIAIQAHDNSSTHYFKEIRLRELD